MRRKPTQRIHARATIVALAKSAMPLVATATAGSGDVLTGVIAALLGQKLPAFEAAQLGVFIHGLAGDVARDHNGEVGLIAGDIVDALPDAFVHATPDHDSMTTTA